MGGLEFFSLIIASWLRCVKRSIHDVYKYITSGACFLAWHVSFKGDYGVDKPIE